MSKELDDFLRNLPGDSSPFAKKNDDKSANADDKNGDGGGNSDNTEGNQDASRQADNKNTGDDSNKNGDNKVIPPVADKDRTQRRIDRLVAERNASREAIRELTGKFEELSTLVKSGAGNGAGNKTLPAWWTKAMGGDEKSVEMYQGLTSELREELKKEMGVTGNGNQNVTTEADKVKKIIDQSFQDIELDEGVDLRSDDPKAAKLRSDFLDYAEDFMPRNSAGEITGLPDLHKVWGRFSEQRSNTVKSVEDQNKERSKKSMQERKNIAGMTGNGGGSGMRNENNNTKKQIVNSGGATKWGDWRKHYNVPKEGDQ